MSTQPSRLWQLDSRWMQYQQARVSGEPMAESCDPDGIRQKYRKYSAQAMGYEDDLPLEYTEDGIAILSVVGMLYKDEYSPFVTSYAQLTEALDELLESPPRAVVLRIDSPGGMVSGCEDVCRRVYALAEQTLVVASINGDGQSAAYRIASQAGTIWASADSEIGSIGTYWQLLDMSAAYAQEGIRSVLLTTGNLKGIGVIGEPITPEQTAYLQAKVDEANARFLTDVSAGRDMTPEAVAAVADGSWYLAEAAQSLRLIDEVGDLDAVLNSIRASFGEPPMSRQKLPTAAETAPAAAAVTPPAVQAGPATSIQAPAAAAPTPDLAQYMQTFGDADGARMYRDGLSWQQSLESALQAARGQVQDLTAENAQLKSRMVELAQAARGESEPIATGSGEKKRSLSEAFGSKMPKR